MIPNEIARQAIEGDIIEGAPLVWLIQTGEYLDAQPLAAVRGTETAAQTFADRWNLANPRSECDRARVVGQIEFHDLVPIV